MARIDPQVWQQPAMLAALAVRDIGRVYKLLLAAGIPQRAIAHATGQAQSEVSEILHGRQVQSVVVLERIADGLGVPHGLMAWHTMWERIFRSSATRRWTKTWSAATSSQPSQVPWCGVTPC